VCSKKNQKHKKGPKKTTRRKKGEDVGESDAFKKGQTKQCHMTILDMADGQWKGQEGEAEEGRVQAGKPAITSVQSGPKPRTSTCAKGVWFPSNDL